MLFWRGSERRLSQGDRRPPTERRTYVGEPLRRLALNTKSTKSTVSGTNGVCEWRLYVPQVEVTSPSSPCRLRRPAERP